MFDLTDYKVKIANGIIVKKDRGFHIGIANSWNMAAQKSYGKVVNENYKFKRKYQRKKKFGMETYILSFTIFPAEIIVCKKVVIRKV